MSKHTPGPWKTWPSIHNGRTYVVENNYKATDYGHVATAVTEADAQLIAAAPELLEALESVLECGSTTDQWWIDKAKAAINKAEGRP